MENLFTYQNLIIILISGILGFSIYMLLSAFLQLPTRKAGAALNKVRIGLTQEVPFENLNRKISEKIKLKEEERKTLSLGLDLSEEYKSYTPEQFVAQIAIISVIFTVVFLPLLFISLPIGLLCSLFGPIYGFVQYNNIKSLIKKHKEAVEREIPRFTQSIYENLKISRDVLAILNAYESVAGKHFGYELRKTIADMKTSNYEDALLRLDARMNSQPVSEVVRGLVGTLRGNDQTSYFDHLSFEMKHFEENMIRTVGMKRPDKMHRLSMAMLGGFFCMLMAVIGTMLMNAFAMFEGAM